MARGAPRTDGLLTAAEAFCLGALGRAIATVATFPAQRANVMAKSGQGGKVGLFAMLLQVYRDDGLQGLYSGMQPEITRGVLVLCTTRSLLPAVAAPIPAMWPPLDCVCSKLGAPVQSAALMMMVKEKITVSARAIFVRNVI
jgi:hypothetical protein